jgi:hypothetical protein
VQKVVGREGNNRNRTVCAMESFGRQILIGEGKDMLGIPHAVRL